MEIGFEIDRIKFSLTSLENYPKHAASLARTFTSFSLIEGAAGGIYGLLKHQEYTIAVEELKSLGTNASRVEAVRKLIKSELPEEEAAPMDKLMKRILSYAQERNKVAHGIWGIHPDDHLLYRLPVKHWITFLAMLVPNAPDASEIIDDLNEHMESWTLEELLQLESDGAKLLEDTLRAFNRLALRAAEQ